MALGSHPVPEQPLALSGAAFEGWARSNVRPQKQSGYATVVATLPLGDVTAAQLGQNVVAREAGEHQVQHDQVGPFFAGRP